MARQQTMKQAMKMMQATGVAYWTTEELKAIDKKVLRKMATWNGVATTGIPDEIKLQMTQKGFSSVDQKHALEMLEMSEEKSTAHSRPESYLQTNGGRMHYTPEIIVHKPLSGEIRQRANSPIPAEFGEVEQRDNVVQCAALCAQFVKVDAGAWVSAVNLTPFITHFKGTEFNAAALPGLTTKITVLLNEDNVWQTLTTVARSSMTGIAAMVFIRQALNRVPESAYNVLNTAIVCDLFRIFQNVGGKWIRVMKDKNTPLLPDSMFEEAECDDESYDLLRDFYPGCYRYLGGEPIVPFMPKADGTIGGALRASQRLREIQGPNDSCTAILAGMRDFSGLTDEFGKRIQACMSVVLSLWASARKVDLQLLTVGDITMFQSTIHYWRTMIQDARSPLEGWDPSLACDLVFLLPGVEDMQKIPQSYRAFVRDNPRDDAVSVHWTKTQIPTAEEKKKMVDYDKSSELVVPRYAHSRDFVAFTTIFGAVPFPQDPTALRRVQQSVCKVDFFKKVEGKELTKLYVYRFSNASAFRGILSTVADLELVGHGYPFLPDKDGNPTKIRDKTKETLHFIPLTWVQTEKSWYDQVNMDCSLQVATFMAPRTRYSPISNLPRMSKNALIINRATLDPEEGTLVGNFVAVRNRAVIGTEVTGWGKRMKAQDKKADPLPKATADLIQHKKKVIAGQSTAPNTASSSATSNSFTDSRSPPSSIKDQIDEEEIVDLFTYDADAVPAADEEVEQEEDRPEKEKEEGRGFRRKPQEE